MTVARSLCAAWLVCLSLLTQAAELIANAGQAKPLYMAIGSDAVITPPALQFAAILKREAAPTARWKFVQMPEEAPRSIYQPGPLQGLRWLFKPSLPS